MPSIKCVVQPGLLNPFQEQEATNAATIGQSAPTRRDHAKALAEKQAEERRARAIAQEEAYFRAQWEEVRAVSLQPGAVPLLPT